MQFIKKFFASFREKPETKPEPFLSHFRAKHKPRPELGEIWIHEAHLKAGQSDYALKIVRRVTHGDGHVVYGYQYMSSILRPVVWSPPNIYDADEKNLLAHFVKVSQEWYDVTSRTNPVLVETL